MGKIMEYIGLSSSAIKSGESWTSSCEEAKREAIKELDKLKGYPCMDAFLFLRKCGFPIKGYYNSNHVVGLLLKMENEADYQPQAILLDDKGIIKDWGYNQTKNEIYLENQPKFIPFKAYGYFKILSDFSELSRSDAELLRKCF